MAESKSGYVHGFSSCTGKTAEVQKDLSGMVLCSPTINLLNQGYRLYLHNYYLKEELLLYSHDNKTYETGTAHADRSGFPKCIIHKSKWGFP